MKKILIVIGVLIITSNLLKAQSLEKKTKLGLEFSPLITWFSTDEKHIENDGVKIGYDFGLNAEFYFSENYAFITGVYFNNHVGSIKYLEEYKLETKDSIFTLQSSESVKYSNKYIRVPIGLKLATNQIGYNTYFARLGVNTLVNYQSKGTSESKSFEKEKTSPSVNVINLNYFIGGGVEISLGSKSAVTLGATYSNGFLNSFSSTNHFATSSQVAINLGLIF